MRKFLLLVLIITASVAFASPPVQDEKLPDPVVKVPVVEKGPTVEHTEAEAEAGPLVQDEAVADSRLVEPDSEHTEAEAGPLVQDEAVADSRLVEPDSGHTEVKAGPLVQDEAVADSRLVEPDSEHTEAEADPLVQDEAVADSRLVEPDSEHTEAEAGTVVQDEAVVDSRLVEPDSVLLEPETTEEHRVPEETQVMLEKPVLEADYLTEETTETELEPEPEITAIQTNRNIVPVEESVAELESETNTEVEDEEEENVNEEPTLEADYITAEDPEIQMEPGRERRRTQIGGWTCKGVVLQGKCYQFFRKKLDASQAEFHCQSFCHNGHLASGASSYILGEMGKLMDRNGGRTRAWLGGWRIFNTRNFIWLDGTQWSYNGWAAGEPNNAGGQDNCVETWYNLAFNDAPCTEPKPFICSCPL